MQPAPDPPDIEHVVTATLDNGLRVSVVADPDQVLVATQVWVHFGGAHEAPDQRGFAHLFEHMMFAGTPTYDREAYARWHLVHGGSRNAYTSLDETVYVSEIAPEAHRHVLEMEADRFRNLSITEAVLERDKKIVTEELRSRRENSPMTRLQTTLRAELFGEHPYAVTPAGTAEDVADVTVDDARAFYEATYRPENLHLVVAGPVDADAVLADVRALFGDLEPGGVAPPEIPSVPEFELPATLELSEDLPPIETTAWLYPIPGPAHPDAVALELMERLLFDGEVDRFREELVERRGKAVDAGGFDLTHRRGGVIALYSIALPDRSWRRADALMAQTVAALDALTWLDEDKLEAARKALLRSELSGAYSAAALASRRGRAAWHLGDEARADDRAEALRAVTVDDVARVWRTWIAQAEPTRAYVSPEEVPLAVRLFGWMVP